MGDNSGASHHVHALDKDNLVWLEVEDQLAAGVVDLTPEHHLATWEDLDLVFMLPIGNVELFGMARLTNDRCRDEVHLEPFKA